MNIAMSTPRMPQGVLTMIRYGFVALALILLTACSGNGGSLSGGGTGGGTTTPACIDDPTLPQCAIPPSNVSVSTSQQQIKSDGSDSATITALVTDTSNAAIEGITVVFQVTSGGVLSSSTAVTGIDGRATVTLVADPGNPANQTVVVTASVIGVGSAVVPVDIVGTTLEIVVNNTLLLILTGNTSVTEPITVIARDAGGKTIYNAGIAMNTSGTPAVLSSATGVTDTAGEVTTNLTSSTPGIVTFTATGLGVTASLDLEVAAEASSPFRITSPTTDPYPLVADGSSVPIVVSAVGVAQVTFSTTIGVFAETGTSVAQIAVAADQATATIVAPPGSAGFATVVATDSADSTVFDKITVAMSPPVTAAAQIILQADVTAIPISTTSVQYSANITALVITDDASGGTPVYNVPVTFSMSNGAGGGEYLTSAYGTTNLLGEVYTKFVSGINATGEIGVTITGTILGTAITDSIAIQIGGEAGSVALGIPREITTVAGNLAAYSIQMSALVADGQGHGVPGAQVALSVWPEHYRTGVWYDDDPDPDTEHCVTYISGFYPNEDLDRDTILDDPSAITGASEDVNMDGELTPPNAAAGSVPFTVTTLDDGTAPFFLTYLKDYSVWVRVAVKGTTKVMGTETTSTRRFDLPILKAEVDSCLVENSPWVDLVHGFPGNLAYLISTPVTTGTPFQLGATVLPSAYADYPFDPALSVPVTDAFGAVVGYQFIIDATAAPGRYLTSVRMQGLGIGADIPVEVIVY